MSVLIKGMEMPKDGTCIFIFASDENGQNTELAIMRYASFEPIKHKGVVALPPHGRLIDADVVANDLQEMSEDVEKSFPYLSKNDALMVERGIAFARQHVLNLAPTIIEAEVEE
ncbi:MAG: hypothetical protein IKD93_02420 [Firmicutes bacterium]|nr:hypothetical protein [Bacillota bacterium]